MILIQQARVFAPQDLGIQDILIAGQEIILIAPSIPVPSQLPVEMLDARGRWLIPGLIDNHCHIAGAGGEGGPGSRTSEMRIEDFLEAGVTTAVGCLGTDGVTRELSSVLMKCKALRAAGITAYMYSGAYQVPPPSLLGDPAKDIAMIEEVLGIGEIAIADHRSAFPSAGELARLASKARVGGMLGGKAGIVNVHLGDAPHPFQLIMDVCNSTELNFKQFLPTHINRNRDIFEDAKSYGLQGWVDITSSSWPFFRDIEVKPSQAVRMLLEAGVPLAHITMSSDAGGSLPHFDAEGKLVAIEIGKPLSLLHEIRDMIREEGMLPETAFRIVSKNVAEVLKLPGKGSIAPGMDADLVLLNEEMLPDVVIAGGKSVYRASV
jgi:beta-aspartyl-dipeptidase (metallo-type)